MHACYKSISKNKSQSADPNPSMKNDDTVTSVDKYQFYLLVNERYSWYVWILIKSKHPPIDQF